MQDAVLPARAALDGLLSPESVAIVGASASSPFSRRLVRNLERWEFAGDVHLVNPRRREIDGRPCHASIGEVPGHVDLAIVMVPLEQVIGTLRQCADAGVSVASVAASGFAETGAAGRALQDEMADIARSSGMRIIGPNCMGVVVPSTGLVATFSQSVDAGLLPATGLAYVGQSGAIGGAILGLCRERGLGLTAWCTAGNEADLTSVEIATAMISRPDVTVVALYLEAVPDGAQWTTLVQAAGAQDKRIVLLRSGRSEAGRRAAASHTGALVRPDAGFDLVSEHHGVITVDDVDELIDVMEAVAGPRRVVGPRLGIITSSGGLGTMMADAVETAGLPLADLADRTTAAISDLIPAFGSVENPVDVTAQLFQGDDGGFERVCAVLLDDDGVDCLAILLTTIVDDAATALATSIARVVADSSKQVFVVWLAPTSQTAPARDILRAAGVSVSSAVRPPLRLLRHLLTGRRPGGPSASVDVSTAAAFVREHTAVLTEHGATPLLEALGVPHPDGELAATSAEAVDAAGRLGGRVVLKAQSPQILHKSDVGAVAVGVDATDVGATFDAVERAARDVPGADLEGILVQEMAVSGTELILSVTGPSDGYPGVLTIGFGGTTAELDRDVCSGLVPLRPDDALAMLHRLRRWPLLAGHRGRPAGDVDALVDAMVALSHLAEAAGQHLQEIEINPLVVHERGIVALDLLVQLGEAPQAAVTA